MRVFAELGIVAPALVKLVFASFLKKAIGATIAIFVFVGFVLGFVVARLIYHRK
jgi:hypothetical protein